MTTGHPHVLLYVSALSTGGAERVAALLAGGFAAAGCAVTVAVDSHHAANAALLPPSVAYRVLGASHAASLWGLAALLRRAGPDVALAVGGGANVKLAAARRLAGGRVPIVLSYHGRSDVGRGRLGQLSFWAAPALSRGAAAVVCVSDGLVDHLVREWGVAPAKVCRIHNPVPVERAIAVGRAELALRPPVVVSVGRLDRDKAFGDLIDAMALIRPEARLVIHGEGPDRAALEARARARGVAARVSLPGYSRDPWPCYAAARCFALASPREAFGNVVVEALASGLPVVATRSGGPEEILEGGRFGTLVAPGDVPALAAGLAAALAEPGDPAPRIARARSFDLPVAVGHYLTLFNRIRAP